MRFMNKIIILTTIFIIIILILSTRNLYNYHKVYEENYFEKIGINKSFFYNDVINSIGKPNNEKEEFGDFDKIYAYYNGITLTFKKNDNESKDKYLLTNARITNSKFRFGKYNIGVNSSYEEIKKAYVGINTIKDAKHGYVDELTWVEFEFDNNMKVKSMLIYYGP